MSISLINTENAIGIIIIKIQILLNMEGQVNMQPEQIDASAKKQISIKDF